MQLPFDFAPKPIPADFGKKVERIPISCSAEFKTLFQAFARAMRSESDSALGFRYLIEGMQNDLGNVFLKNPEIIQTLLSHYLKR